MTRENKEFKGSTLVTQEEVDLCIAWCREAYDPSNEFIVEKMWQEIKDLRATLEKQMY